MTKKEGIDEILNLAWWHGVKAEFGFMPPEERKHHKKTSKHLEAYAKLLSKHKDGQP